MVVYICTLFNIKKIHFMGWILFLIFLCIISFVLGWTILGWILVAFFVTAVVALIWINNESQKTQEKLKKINESNLGI